MGFGITIRCANCYEDDKKGTYYELLLDSGMMCFCKEQLEKYYGINKKYDRESPLLSTGDPPEELYSKLDSPVKDKKINTEIYENIKNGYEFTEHLGNTPYFCETCNKLLSLFYFQMERNGNYYIPKYHCYKCKNVLEPLRIIWENTENDNEEDDPLENIGIKYRLYIKNDNTIKIVSETNEEKKLICRWCNNDKFMRDEEGDMLWD
ncbi:MAG: hypothetical protein LBI28_03135 [Treponema sp.]|jgi:hypothetical protein|nr:hypothetical protein [Treponema sp.]